METLPESSKNEKMLKWGLSGLLILPLIAGLVTVLGREGYGSVRRELNSIRRMGAENNLNVKSNSFYISATNFLNNAKIDYNSNCSLEDMMEMANNYRTDNNGVLDARLNNYFSKANVDFSEYKKAREKLELRRN